MEKFRYEIEFFYTDNDQIFQLNGLLTVEEAARIEAYLCALEEAGAVRSDTGGGCFVNRYHEPGFMEFAAVVTDLEVAINPEIYDVPRLSL